MRLLAALMAALLLLACGDDAPWHAVRAEEVRELEFLEYPSVERMTQEAYRADVAADVAQISDAQLAEYAETYGRFGYFDMNLDLRPIYVGSGSDWVGGMYFPGAGHILIIGEPKDDALVHEYVHALQDQHFGFDAVDRYDSSDAFLARRAIIEGDATLAQYRFALQEAHGVDLGSADWLGVFNVYRGTSDALIQDGDYPPVFLDYPTFCYAYGLELTAHNLTGARYDDPSAARFPPYDWADEDALFLDPPVDTTQAVLRLGIDVDEVEKVGLSEVPAELADRLEVVDRDVLGEWYVFLLFFEAGRGIAATRAIASTWDGDRVLFVRDTETGDYGFVWTSAWDDINAVANVVDSMWRIYGRNPAKTRPANFALADDGEGVWIEHRANHVVVTKNLAYELIGPMVEAAFAAEPTSRVTRLRPSLAEFSRRFVRPSSSR